MGCFFTKPPARHNTKSRFPPRVVVPRRIVEPEDITKPFLAPKVVSVSHIAEPSKAVAAPTEQIYAGNCKVCHKNYSRNFPTDFCSKICKESYRTTVLTKSCSKCGSSFEVSGSEDYKTMCGRAACLDPTKIEVIKEKLATKGYSSKGILWLNKIMADQKIQISHAENGGEVKKQFGKYTLSFDGYCEATKTVYEFYGTHYHGDPVVLAGKMDQISPNGKDTYQRLYEKTKWREDVVTKAGYNLVTIWEREFDALRE